MFQSENSTPDSVSIVPFKSYAFLVPEAKQKAAECFSEYEESMRLLVLSNI